MLSRVIRSVLIVGLFLLFPRLTAAQSAIAGVVKDSSGGVLPGVTVEASSPALIEKTKSATTNEQGQYRIVDLRPGMYTVTFSLSGFKTVVRGNIQLESNFTAPINVETERGSHRGERDGDGWTVLSSMSRRARRQSVVSQQLIDASADRAQRPAVAGTLPAVFSAPSTSVDRPTPDRREPDGPRIADAATREPD